MENVLIAAVFCTLSFLNAYQYLHNSMLDSNVFLKFLYASFLVNLIPSADRRFVVSSSLSDSRRAGILASLGISTGIFIHSLFGGFGLVALVLSYPHILP